MKGARETERTLPPDNAKGSRAKTTTTKLKIATYNVRTLKHVGSLDILMTGCTNFDISILAIQEHRQILNNNIVKEWSNDNQWLKIMQTADATGYGGIGFIINKKLASKSVTVEEVNSRIMVLHVENNPRISAIVAYAPTENAEEAAKEEFYCTLSKTIESVPPHNIQLVLGDFNARIGKDSNRNNPRIVGQHTFHDETNANGERLVSMCESHSLRPTSSRFPHRKGRQWTWEHPSGKTAQLDHILISSKWVNSVRNCRAYDTMNIDSDHRVLCANVNISFRTSKSNKLVRAKYNTELLNDIVKSCRFDIELRNRFDKLRELNDEIDHYDPRVRIQPRYDALERAIQETSEEVLGKKSKDASKPWISRTTNTLLANRDKQKKKYRQHRNTANYKAWKKLADQASAAMEKDENEHLENKLAQLENAAKRNQLGRTWQIINSITGKNKQQPIQVCRLDGTQPSSNEEIMQDWATYFRDLLNAAPPANEANPEPAQVDLPIQTGRFTVNEVNEAIDQLHLGKSPGTDSCITPEIIKLGGSYIRTQIHHICNNVYTTHVPPKQWTNNIIIPIPKKGNLQEMKNYRGITLMSIAAKVYNKLLLNRITPHIDPILRNNQAGFRPQRSCIQQIHILRRLIEGANLRQLPLIITFIDFKKAFDSICRQSMFAILRHYGVPKETVEAVKALYNNTTSQVFVNGSVSEPFRITTGVQQGDVLAPTLFIIVMDYVMKNAENNFGFTTHPRQCSRSDIKRLNDLDFADDIALLESEAQNAQEQLTTTSNIASTVGLEINTEKTKTVVFNVKEQPCIQLYGKTIEIVQDFKYLGSRIASCQQDFTIRKAQAWQAFWQLKSIWTSKSVHTNTKVRIFQASCVSILLYGSETWVLTEQMKNQINSFATNAYRIMLGIKKQDHIANETIYEKTKQEPLTIKTIRRQLTWIGHMLRREESEPINIYALYKPSTALGKSKAGRPTQSYVDYITGEITGKFKCSPEELKAATKDRKAWRQTVIACTSSHKPL